MKTTGVIISCLLVTSLTTNIVMADNNKTIDSNKSINNKIVKGTTIGHYQKPGAPIDIIYSSTRVALNEISDVNISLVTSVKSGDMEVDIDVDKNLKVEGESYSKITFSLDPNEKDYNFNLKVSGSKDGLYYIRLLTKIANGNGAKMRAFAVPIYVGNGKLKSKSTQLIMKALGGEHLSISKAQESVEILK
jgi:hypothetical protein